MKAPTLQEEKRLWKKGYQRVACLDEAGRGCLAGPVVAAAVVIKKLSFKTKKLSFYKLKDSKQLSWRQREHFYKIITKDPNIKWGMGIVSEKVIDKINILEATKLAMAKALKKLEVDFLILDGNFKINSSTPQKSIVKADEKVFSCALASIIAKVVRDRIMIRLHEKYPQYGLDKHKGYPTQFHRAMLNKYGRCAIHRNSFHYKS